VFWRIVCVVTCFVCTDASHVICPVSTVTAPDYLFIVTRLLVASRVYTPSLLLVQKRPGILRENTHRETHFPYEPYCEISHIAFLNPAHLVEYILPLLTLCSLHTVSLLYSFHDTAPAAELKGNAKSTEKSEAGAKWRKEKRTHNIRKRCEKLNQSQKRVSPSPARTRHGGRKLCSDDKENVSDSDSRGRVHATLSRRKQKTAAAVLQKTVFPLHRVAALSFLP